MKPRITVLSLGVDDLERSLRFYRGGLGLAGDGIVGQEFSEFGPVRTDVKAETSMKVNKTKLAKTLIPSFTRTQ